MANVCEVRGAGGRQGEIDSFSESARTSQGERLPPQTGATTQEQIAEQQQRQSHDSISLFSSTFFSSFRRKHC